LERENKSCSTSRALRLLIGMAVTREMIGRRMRKILKLTIVDIELKSWVYWVEKLLIESVDVTILL